MVEIDEIKKAYLIRELSKKLKIEIDDNLLDNLSDKIRSLSNNQEILKHIESQEKGLPLEFQFAYICYWLGKCSHFQFIDPSPDMMHNDEGNDIKHSDAFAEFSYNDRSFPCLIQIKSYHNKTLKLSKTYVEKLKKHPFVQNYPILIAWKWGNFWTLFDIETFRTPNGGLKVHFTDAIMANLMSLLAGDFAFQGFKEGIESKIEIIPNDLEEMKQIKIKKLKKFLATVKRAAICDPDTGNEIDNIEVLNHLFDCLGIWDGFERYTDNSIIQGDINMAQISLFGSQALIYGTEFSQKDSSIDWKHLYEKKKFLFTKDELKKLIIEGQKKKMGFDQIINFYPSTENPCIKKFANSNNEV